MKTRTTYNAEILSSEPFNWQLSVKHYKEILSRYKSLQDSTLDSSKIDFESSYRGIKLNVNENEFIVCFNFTVIHFDHKVISIKFDESRSLENFIFSTIPKEAPQHVLRSILSI